MLSRKEDIVLNIAKKNNRGFSLVELIVVVMIMAIIAVALAPQIMKWVANSRTATDVQMYDQLVENIHLALADDDVYGEVNTLADGTYITFTIKGDKTEVTSNIKTNFENKLKELCGDNWKTEVRRKDSTAADYIIKVSNNSIVVRDTVPDTDTVK